MLTLLVSRAPWTSRPSPGAEGLPGTASPEAGVQQQVAADGFQPGVVGEHGELDLADRLGLHLAIELDLDLTAAVGRGVDPLGRNDDAGLDGVAVRGHHGAVGIELERTGSGIGGA